MQTLSRTFLGLPQTSLEQASQSASQLARNLANIVSFASLAGPMQIPKKLDTHPSQFVNLTPPPPFLLAKRQYYSPPRTAKLFQNLSTVARYGDFSCQKDSDRVLKCAQTNSNRDSTPAIQFIYGEVFAPSKPTKNIWQAIQAYSKISRMTERPSPRPETRHPSHKRPLDSLFDDDSKQMGRIKLRKNRVKEFYVQQPEDDTAENEKITMPLQRQLVDLVHQRKSQSWWTLSLGSTPENDLSVPSQSLAKTYLTLTWGPLNQRGLLFHVKIVCAEHVAVLSHGEWIDTRTGDNLSLGPGERLRILTGSKDHILELPQPYSVSTTIKKVQEAYDFFNLPLNCDKKTAKKAYRIGLHSNHPDHTKLNTGKELQRVLQNWEMIQWYNGWW